MSLESTFTYVRGDLARALMDLKKEMALAIMVKVKDMPDDFMNEYICRRANCYWHHSLDNPNTIWVYQNEVLREVIEYMDANRDNPLHLWAHLKMQGFSNRSVIERLEEEKIDA